MDKQPLTVCRYCHSKVEPGDPFHVHGHNECLCGEKPVHNAHLHEQLGSAPVLAGEAGGSAHRSEAPEALLPSNKSCSPSPSSETVARLQMAESLIERTAEALGYDQNGLTFRERQLGRALITAALAQGRASQEEQ